MYCHEGTWQQVDRIWTIRTDGTQNQLVHKRIMEMEIAGHEWWGADGDTIWYQLQFPRNVPGAGFISGYNVKTGARVWYHQDLDAGSIHHNTLARREGLLRRRQHAQSVDRPLPPGAESRRPHARATNLIDGGSLKVERLVNMSKTAIHGAQNYRLEPNPMFTPDQKYVIFRANERVAEFHAQEARGRIACDLGVISVHQAAHHRRISIEQRRIDGEIVVIDDGVDAFS